MTITNQTLMWLAPVTAAAAMTIVSAITNWIDTRRPAKAKTEADPTFEGSAKRVDQTVVVAQAEVDIEKALATLQQSIETVTGRVRPGIMVQSDDKPRSR